ncbi:glycosyltransferase family 2 protein [Rhodopirellula halodulae]|uniref:glycosyltransferase family 2 protein n=1 Tax=Rhodopirellula halodulae TaxID=2894198 RepID=UPI001E3870EA|nr:glycosyltransferase family A protein [Rhodopirellula sp. JC737]MCC9656525.1 glycosyltransferase family 2 protein [Rhodopirellula sp. JC737]
MRTSENIDHSPGTQPLVTFALFAYNQEQYIEQAIAGAFAQTYENLEIILSDDDSSDRTYQIMCDAANSYSGPHRVVLNKNLQNSGIGAHVNRLMELAHGELVVVAAGDDISLPQRTSKIVECWMQNDQRPMSIHSACIRIDADGNTVNTKPPTWTDRWSDIGYLIKEQPTVEGATHAWDTKAFRRFGPLLPDIVYEDKAMAFRMALVGDVKFIESQLVKYRVSVGVTRDYGRDDFRRQVFGPSAARRLTVAKQMEIDLQNYCDSHPLLPFARRCLAYRELVYAFPDSNARHKSRRNARSKGVSIFQIAKLYIYFYFPRLSARLLSRRKSAI